MRFVPTFINANNPQLTLLAHFLGAMAEANEEATFRVFRKLTIICDKSGFIRVDGPTGQMDIGVERFNPDEVVATDEERIELLMTIFKEITK